MLCYVYKSSKKSETYLYVEKQGDFSRVPDTLLDTFGKPLLVLTFDLSAKRKLAGADVDKVRSELAQTGFYLQLPKPEESMLAIHHAMQLAEEKLEQEQQNASLTSPTQH